MGLFLALLALIGPAAGLVRGQFKAGVDLVEVYATVTDSLGKPLTGLSASDFRVTENGQPQTISAFAVGDVPLAVAIGIDHSFSVPRQELTRIVSAAERFLEELRPEDEVMIVGIGSETRVAPLSTNRAAAVSALRDITPWGTTPLFDAVVQAIAAIDAASGRRALVLLSDGVDRYSRTTAAAMIAEARARNVLVYPVISNRSTAADLQDVARVTGGRAVTVRDRQRLVPEIQRIATELRAQYLIGYSSQAARPETPTWRTIRVTVSHPEVTVRAREGYLAR
jgi:Ca-activated chloride channel family protein